MIEYIAGGVVGLLIWLVVNAMINAKIAVEIASMDDDIDDEVMAQVERTTVFVWWASLISLVVLFGVIGGIFLA